MVQVFAAMLHLTRATFLEEKKLNLFFGDAAAIEAMDKKCRWEKEEAFMCSYSTHK